MPSKTHSCGFCTDEMPPCDFCGMTFEEARRLADEASGQPNTPTGWATIHGPSGSTSVCRACRLYSQATAAG